MKALYERFPLTGGGFTKKDLRATVEDIAGGSFTEFFDLYVDGTAPLPLEDAVKTVGLELVLDPADKSKDKENDKDDTDGDSDLDGGDEPVEDDPPTELYLGLDLFDRGDTTIVRAVRSDGPAHRAGLLPGDQIVALDHRRLAADDLDKRLELYGKVLADGQSVTLHVLRHDDLLTLELVPDQRQRGVCKLKRLEEPTAEQRSNYQSWSGQPWPDEKTDRKTDEKTPDADDRRGGD
jgi:predicted metalloprotease with PDZ domain